MKPNLSEFVWIFLLWLCSPCCSLLTGTHYLTTISCSPSTLYIPQGPYLFSHHWPFTSISVHYDGETTLGTCYRDGSLYFALRNDKVCSGIYYAGHAKLLCRFEGEAFCTVDMKTADGSPLTCAVSKIRVKFSGLILLSFFLVLLIL